MNWTTFALALRSLGEIIATTALVDRLEERSRSTQRSYTIFFAMLIEVELMG